MGVLKSLFSAPVIGPRFRMMGTTVLTPESYGEMALKSSWQGSVAEIQDLCNGPASELQLVAAAGRRALHAAVNVNMLRAAIYIWYAASVFRVEPEVMKSMDIGLKKALGDFTVDGKTALTSDFRSFLLRQIYAYVSALENDDRELETRREGVFRVNALPSNELLIDCPCSALGADEHTTLKWKEEILLTLAGYHLRTILDISNSAAISAIKDGLGLSFER